MSRGFVKEDDQEETPLVPPRADLPKGVINYVTQVGFDELLTEKHNLVNEIEQLDVIDEKEKRIASNYLTAKLKLLNQRVSIAKIIDLTLQPKDEIRFGATVILKIDAEKKVQKYQIVGVDEANISKGKISFVSPIAKMLTHKKVGDQVVLKLEKAERVFEVLDIAYVVK